jgi:hypothetical protein
LEYSLDENLILKIFKEPYLKMDPYYNEIEKYGEKL